VTKPQSAGPISCLEHRATRVLHCTIVTAAAVLMFPLLLHVYGGIIVQRILSVVVLHGGSRNTWLQEIMEDHLRVY